MSASTHTSHSDHAISHTVGLGHDKGTVTLEIAGLEVTLPVKFAAGQVLTENQAKVLDAAYQRQFTNNQNAGAKSREEALKAGKTDDKYQPLSAAAIAALYSDYEPAVGGSTRASTMEKVRQDAAWRVFLARVAEHNGMVEDGQPGLFKGQQSGRRFIVPTGKGAPAFRDSAIANVLGADRYADLVQSQIDLILAEKASQSKKEGKATGNVNVDLGDLLED